MSLAACSMNELFEVGRPQGRPIVSPPCGKVNLDRKWLSRLAFTAQKQAVFALLEELDETDIQATQSTPQEQARLPRPHEDAVGACRAESSAQKRTEEAGGERAVEARARLKPEGLPRNRRLTRASDIRLVQQRGRRFRTSTVDVTWSPNRVGHPRLALVVPRRGHTAVARNKLRRRLRELGRRRILPRLRPLDVVLRTRARAYTARFADLAADLESWLLSLRD